MKEHPEHRFDLPGYVAGRLDPAEREEVERHLAGCGECRDLEETIREMASAIREGGEAIFEPHPPEGVLRRIGQGEVVPDREGIERHLKLCAACELEVDAWRADTGGAPLHHDAGRRGPTRRWGMRSSMSFGLAAGLAVGVGLAILFRSAIIPAGGTRPPRIPAAAPPAEASAVLLHLLPAAQRGESKAVRWEIGRPEKWIAVGVPLALPNRFDETTPIRFELASREGAEGASVFLGAGEVRRHLAASELVTLMLKTDHLTPGRYDFTVRVESPGGEEILYRNEVEIVAAPDPPGKSVSP
jgi:anti-sigma factor RsiW